MNIKFNYELFKFKYYPINVDIYKNKVLAIKFSTTFTEIVDINIKTGKETLYKLENPILDCNPIGMYDYDDYYIIVGQSFDNGIRIYKYDKKERKEIIYNYLKEKVKNIYSEQIGKTLYISVLGEVSGVYILNCETPVLSIFSENDKYYMTYIKEIEGNFILTQGISLQTNNHKSIVYDQNWNQVESISFNQNSNDFCYAFDAKRHMNIVASDVLGEKTVFLQKDNEISNITVCDSIDTFNIEDYIYDKGLLIYQVEQALTCKLNIYELDTGHIHEIIHDQLIYMVKNFDNTIVILGNSIHSALVVSIYDLSKKKIIASYSYPQDNFEIKTPKKKYIEVNGHKMNYIEYPPHDYTKINGYIIYLHGGPAIHWLPKYNEMFSQFQKNNFCVIYPNYFGSSQCGTIDYNKHENKWGLKDLDEILFLRKKITHKNVILIGESYGAYLALKAWNRSPNDWTGLITYASFYTPWSLYESGSNLVKETVKRHISESDINHSDMEAYSKEEDISTKIFLLHGKCDEVIPYEQSINIFEYLNRTYKFNSKPILKLIANGSHSLNNMHDKSCVERYICKSVEEITFS
ncbi:alpha/beta hydrolase family protein [Oceanirhabdus sp. W0125-5]|uniref:alpha/beta hydrolase family protein n=1 Tax=Oceanirhabdus sp. W0125-5 TaxID=2999116 RepID=UPI0022F2A6F9|nr:prolyl oligopeptidase family serine peptidase [Oceanirhabdus sp. W0125-5]WBW97576.1 prolyl oligopeptidase family serine peptidase [Oceanirhabdus sp. W0125-5]